MALPPSVLDSIEDPRLTPQFVRHVPGSNAGDVLLVGVVHDHPASVSRVRLVLEACERHEGGPDVLALELPAAALPLYRSYAREERSPPRFGGEMSAAIQATDAEVVGIDAPNWSFCRRLCSRLVADRVSPSVARRVLSSLGGATREALTCRLAATLADATSMTVAASDAIEYGCTLSDSPDRQATHERAHVSGVQALLGAVGDREAADGEGLSALAYRDETRERCMVDRLESHRETNDVVAVVGVDHLDSLEAALSS